MFKRKDKQDVIHQTNIKRGITSHFARTLKVLQQRHLKSDSAEFIYSDDYSNNLCSALEAVFLHGLKDSVVTKMSSYVGLASAQDQAQYINFWGMCAKFTHSDVITQLRRLAQINTDIGLCRAWIRMALNDGLMESYLHSMIVDHKVLTYYYHSHSYLRDHEQPGILKNFLTGLMSLDFKLSFNSSVLNAWNNTSLQLAGLLDSRHIPQPTVSQVTDTDQSISTEAQRRKKDEPIIVNNKTITKNNNSQVPGGISSTQDGVIGSHPMFSTIQDVEEIRRITLAKMGLGGGSSGLVGPQSVTSEGSTSSHISCPDPGSISAQINRHSKSFERELGGGSAVISPALYPRADRDRETVISSSPSSSSSLTEKKVEMRNHNHFLGLAPQQQDSDVQSVGSLSDLQQIGEDQSRRGSKASSVIIEDSSPFFPLEMAMSPPRPRSRRVNEDDLKTMSPASPRSLTNISMTHSSPSHSLSNSPKPTIYSSVGTANNSVLDTATEEVKTKSDDVDKKDGNNLNSLNADSGARNRGTTFRGYEEICANLPPIKLDPVEQDAILRKVLGEIDDQADIERAKREEQRMNMSYDEAFEDLKPTAKVQHYSARNEKSEKKGGNSNKSVERDSGISVYGVATSTPQLKKEIDIMRENKNEDKTKNRVESPVKRSPEHKGGENTSLENASTSQTAVKTVGFVDDQMDTDIYDFKIDDVVEGREEEGEEGKTLMMATGVEEGGREEEESSSPPSGNFGNSLSGMTGWSSQLESSPRENNDKLRGRTRGESFATMLKTYAGESSLISTTLDQVIQTFYGDQADGGIGNSIPSPTGLSAEDDAQMVERQDSCLEGFEILSPTSELFYNVHETDTSRSIFLFRIPREHGLSHQNFICRGCSRPIGIIYGQPRLCEFDGGLYCYECHENNEIVVPSYIVYNWDFSKRKVSVENFKFLQALEDQALYDLDELNTKLETHVPEIGTIKVLRHQLCFLKSYMFNCTQKVAESLRQRVWPREHLYERASVYSVNDFHQVQSGVLMRFVKDLVKFASKHVYQCSLCSQKGFVCEICRNPQVIFPFELDSTTRCSTCKSVYHKTCLTESLPCPKCERWGRREPKKAGGGGGDETHPEDYGMSPPSI